MSQAVTLKHLRYLVAVADTLHFGRAADAANISQPSLSAQIQQLEEALGTQLVERTKRRVMLTPIGTEVAERARRILAEVRDLADSVQGVAAPLAGDLRLGVIPTVGPYLLPRVLPSLRRTYPDLRLYLREDQTGRLVERLKGGDLDTLMLAMPVAEPSFEAEPLFDETFVVALPAGHRLAARNQVSESDLADEQVLLLEDGHCFRDQALAVCGDARARDRESFAATSLDTLREMVASRIGITLLPALSVTGASAPNGSVEIRPFAPPCPSRRVALVWRREAARGREFKELAQFLRDNLPLGAEPVG
ncbi:LysR family transcriptional regulator [Skermanella rosea]|uniref:LysR substrate-binding domain-containing protein n=1 Tax=Skermanella rosea TaxID=1817965 RepID=UPI001934AF95|nr:LysR substrate-binding domain-containing protein [Skermanella rosea]UEM04400.1 LysR family transcriptional regulator [Skermanella rosea]